MEQENAAEPQQHIFDEYVEHTIASTGQRFLNWLIDNLLMQYGLAFLTGSAVGYMIGTLFPDFALRIAYSQNKYSVELLTLGYAIYIVNYLFYYTICEKAFKGHTLGKLITGTRAIRNDGNELTFKDALLRTLCRLVPFEAFSGFAYKPWHDEWTKTQVIKTR